MPRATVESENRHLLVSENRHLFLFGPVLFGRRFYDPNLQRWINRDPIAEAGGPNLYAYCGNDPANWGDLRGLCPVGEADLYLWSLSMDMYVPMEPVGNLYLSLLSLDMYGTMEELAVAGFSSGGIIGGSQGNFYSFATALLDTLGGQAVAGTASLSGTASGEGNTKAFVGWGLASVGLVAVNAYSGGQAASAVGKLGTYAVDPVLYEIGSKTLPSAEKVSVLTIDSIALRARLSPWRGRFESSMGERSIM